MRKMLLEARRLHAIIHIRKSGPEEFMETYRKKLKKIDHYFRFFIWLKRLDGRVPGNVRNHQPFTHYFFLFEELQLMGHVECRASDAQADRKNPDWLTLMIIRYDLSTPEGQQARLDFQRTQVRHA